MGVDDLNEEKMDELLRLMRSIVPDTSDMNDAGRIGFVYKQNYDPTASYEELDVVKFGMSLWTPKGDTTGNAPPDQSQEGQENVEENDFWKLFLPGALGSDYVKKTDLATPEKPGIVQPDGKTIRIKNNLLVGAGSLTMKKAEFEEKLANGEIEDGTIVNVEDDYLTQFDIDNHLSETSLNPVQNRVITAALGEVRDLLGGISFSVTEEGLVRASWNDEQEGEQ